MFTRGVVRAPARGTGAALSNGESAGATDVVGTAADPPPASTLAPRLCCELCTSPSVFSIRCSRAFNSSRLSLSDCTCPLTWSSLAPFASAPAPSLPCSPCTVTLIRFTLSAVCCTRSFITPMRSSLLCCSRATASCNCWICVCSCTMSLLTANAGVAGTSNTADTASPLANRRDRNKAERELRMPTLLTNTVYRSRLNCPRRFSL